MINHDFEKKRKLLDLWISSFKNNFNIRLFSKGDIIKKESVINQINILGSKFPDENFIYIVIIRKENSDIPVYIGKSNNLSSRWNSHLKKLEIGKGLYSKWRNLLFDSFGKIRYETLLMAVPSSYLKRPPIPDFPTTVGSVEYQLVGLASDAYPDTLLNQEGNRR